MIHGIKYDAFLRRHACLHWKTQSIYIYNNGKYAKYSEYKHVSNLNQLDQIIDKWFAKLKQYLYKDGCALLNYSNPVGLFAKLMVTNPGSSKFHNKDFAMIKNIIQPKHMFVSTIKCTLLNINDHYTGYTSPVCNTQKV